MAFAMPQELVLNWNKRIFNVKAVFIIILYNGILRNVDMRVRS